MIENDLLGIHKKWVLADKKDYDRLCDYYQKINYSLQDINRELESKDVYSLKSVVYITVLMDWVWEATEKIKSLIREDIRSDFQYIDKQEWLNARDYFRAFRSFVVAHPLTTDRHGSYGFDGSLICVDIRPTLNVVSLKFCRPELFFRLTLDGLQKHVKEMSDDICLMSYSSSDQMQYFKYITCNMMDLEKATVICLKEMKAFEKYIDKQKQKDNK